MGLSSRSCSPGNAAASAAPAAVSPPGDPAAATAAAEGLPGQVCPAGRWLRARPEGSGWPQARGWRGQGRAPGTAALGQAHLLCLIYILMRHLQLLWGCSQEKRWGFQLRRPPTQPVALQVRERSWEVRREPGNGGWTPFRHLLVPCAIPAWAGCPSCGPAGLPLPRSHLLPSPPPFPSPSALPCFVSAVIPRVAVFFPILYH